MMKTLIEKLFSFGSERVDYENITTVERLQKGNEYFTSYMLQKSPISNIERVRYLALNGQNPHAVLVTCSDARISPERIFNAEMGDFFIIRTAGNVIGELELGSIEYAISKVGTDTIIVMGHENCGAVLSAAMHTGKSEGCIGKINEIIKPSLDKAEKEAHSHIELLAKAEDYNIQNTVYQIKSSAIIRQYIDAGKVTLVGAKYGIASGKVTFYEPEK